MSGKIVLRIGLMLIFLALSINIVNLLLPAREAPAQAPEVLIAQATERVAQANQQVAQALEKLAEATYTSKLRIAEAVAKAGRR